MDGSSPVELATATQRWSSACFGGGGLHVYYMVAAAVALLQQRVYVDRIYCTSAGFFAAMYYIMDWRTDINLTQLIEMLPTGRKRKNPSWCSRIFSFFKSLFRCCCCCFCCCGNRKRRDRYKFDYRHGDGQGSDTGVDLMRDRV